MKSILNLSKRKILSQFATRECFTVTKKNIGCGVYGVISEVKRNVDKKIFAKKTILDSEDDLNTEIKALDRIKELNIAPVILCTGEDHSFFIMEKINGVTLGSATIEALFDSGEKVTESQKMELYRDFGFQMFSAVKMLHECNIYHYDISPYNWMVKKDKNCYKIFLIDFGLSKIDPKEDVNKYYNIDIIATLLDLQNWALRLGF